MNDAELEALAEERLEPAGQSQLVELLAMQGDGHLSAIEHAELDW